MNMSERRPSICFTLTSPFALSAFLLGHIRRLSKSADITVCVNFGESDIPIHLPAGVTLQPVEIRRDISPIHDLRALFLLWRNDRRERFSAVLSITPKGGLLGMLAARLAGVPVRVHWFTGQVWATKKGAGRAILKWVDRLMVACATGVLADSPSQRDFLITEGIVTPEKIGVLGDGSISGVDVARFQPEPTRRARIRAVLNIPNDDPCLLYVGRMKREKGVLDLLSAFCTLHQEFPRLHLILVGPDEENLLEGADEPGRHVVGYAKEVEDYMAAADIFCLPSYREGFGSVLIEAAAAGLPSVASRIYGITDAVLDGETGLLHRPGDPGDLARALRTLLQDEGVRQEMAITGRRRALESFSSGRIEGLFDAWMIKVLEGRKNLPQTT
jgi:glycosyltransferase involved in cell wall biosynthesis